MKKTLRNVIIGSLAFFTGATIYTLTRRRMGKENLIIEKEEELEREYIDLSDQLKQVKKENEELKDEVKIKEYTA